MNPVAYIPDGVFAALVFGAIGLLAIFTLAILYIFVRETREGSIW